MRVIQCVPGSVEAGADTIVSTGPESGYVIPSNEYRIAEMLDAMPKVPIKGCYVILQSHCLPGWIATKGVGPYARMGVGAPLLNILVKSIASSNRNGPWIRFLRGFGLVGGILFYTVPVVTSTIPRGLRIASGVSSLATAVVVVPLRTLDEIPNTAWIITYAVPSELSNRRKLYLFCVIVAAIHFSIAISQNTDNIVNGFTIYTRIVITVGFGSASFRWTTFCLALVLGTIGQPTD
ncbi:uncharacterized protein F4822DRAFT_52840 [Hypoxylon trugodes]|uniref:uncharacterized protein n=1 Tax=Hypoxylon trugodes TaxID=326681 RepID=UPI0021984FDC|nr:uncharacterized protein F4822DRAFT_52840 [Hypoxylon trugodes]KAI1383827.1 hypothetical protein F4822DRAFT_52840 [Hypoxylon trugodes]